ncbi:MAG: hypothetical protein WCO07_03135 [bacterium]
MINQQLLDFIKKQNEQGVGKEKINADLLNNGWRKEDVEEAFLKLNMNSSVIPVPPYENNINISSGIIKPELKPKKHLIKKIILSILFVGVIFWGVIEIINYGEYVSAKNEWNPTEHCNPNIPMPCFGPRYQFVIVHVFYKIFPSLDPDYGIAYKPVIYLYPITTEKIQVQLDYKGTLIADYPPYDMAQKGWTVTAFPDGKIIGSDGREYSYLFWEGEPKFNPDYDLTTGFVVKGQDTVKFLQETLSRLGLTPKEYNEFIVYWYPKMKDNTYNLIHFAEKEYTNIAPLTIIPKPDSLLRVFMVFKPLDKAVEVKPQEIKPFVRNGFTVVEWGGTELSK